MSSKCELLFIGDSIIHQMLDKEVKKAQEECKGKLT